MAKNKYQAGLAKRIEKKDKENKKLQKHIRNALYRAAKKFYADFPSLARLAVAGSLAKGNFSDESDVDIVVSGLAKEDYFKLYNYLEKILNRKIDLIVEEELSEGDKAHILKNKEIIYDRKKSRSRNLKNT